MAVGEFMAGQEQNNRQSDIARGYNFQVYFDDRKVSFARVSGIEKSISTESFSEGGMNHRSYIIGKANQTENIMTFERGYTISNTKSGFELEPGYRFEKDVCIYVMNENAKAEKAYYLSGGVVRKVSIGDFDASRSELLIEKIEIIYEILDKENL